MADPCSCFSTDADGAIVIEPVAAETLAETLSRFSQSRARWARDTGFDAAPGSVCLLPGDDGRLERVLLGVEPTADPFAFADLSNRLPPGTYSLQLRPDRDDVEQCLLGFALGAYRFERYRAVDRPRVRLLLPTGAAARSACLQARAICLARDLINTPANDMMPTDLAAESRQLAERFGAELRVVEGDALLAEGYPSVHAVGRASAHAPALIDLSWGSTEAAPVTLVGKGVCFDSGGLDIKPASGMRLMKKDMGGAAHALALAQMIMEAQLPIRLRLLVPAVENAISGSSLRPGDVLRTRAGISVEIDNTDAEGRVILADALAAACEQPPDLLLDFATLTGAARVAVGTEIAAMFASDDEVATAILERASALKDPVWRLPLHDEYAPLLESKIADIANSAAAPYAGAITAALFLKRFVSPGVAWLHFDIMAWNTRARPGRPEGGEAMALRALFDYLRTRFG